MICQNRFLLGEFKQGKKNDCGFILNIRNRKTGGKNNKRKDANNEFRPVMFVCAMTGKDLPGESMLWLGKLYEEKENKVSCIACFNSNDT